MSSLIRVIYSFKLFSFTFNQIRTNVTLSQLTSTIATCTVTAWAEDEARLYTVVRLAQLAGERVVGLS